MKIPKTVKIGPHTYEIKFEEKMSNNHDSLGLSVHEHGLIKLDPDMTQTQIEDTFLHEVLHCMNQQTEVFKGEDKDAKEDSVKRLAPLLLQFIKDNPEIFKND